MEVETRKLQIQATQLKLSDSHTLHHNITSYSISSGIKRTTTDILILGQSFPQNSPALFWALVMIITVLSYV